MKCADKTEKTDESSNIRESVQALFVLLLTREWLPGPNSRKKWFNNHLDVNDNDVLLIEPDNPRGKRSMAKILETVRGKDGHTRVVKVQVGDSLFTRSLMKVNEFVRGWDCY